MLAIIGERPSEKPREIPIAEPTSRPSSDSSSVTARWRHSDPVAIHCTIRCAISDGGVTKNPSRTFSETRVCQTVSTVMPRAACQNSTAEADGPALRTAMLRRALALDHLFAQHRPDRAIEVDERRRGAQ